MTQPGNNQPMPLEAFIYVLKSIFGPDMSMITFNDGNQLSFDQAA